MKSTRVTAGLGSSENLASSSSCSAAAESLIQDCKGYQIGPRWVKVHPAAKALLIAVSAALAWSTTSLPEICSF